MSLLARLDRRLHVRLIARSLWTFVILLLAARAAAAKPPWKQYAEQDDAWYRSEAGATVAANILSYQTAQGAWPKNVDTTAQPYNGAAGALSGTFDNSATLDELRFLARACRATGDARMREAFFNGLDHVLTAQYANGGWPQHYPPGKSYARYITFNDGTMVGLMHFVRDIADRPLYEFVDAERRRRAADSFQRGIRCILRCQIMVDGRLTAWCAQHDEQIFEPRGARTFELASLSGAESVDIVRLLMSLPNPSPEVVQAIESAGIWFQSAKLSGIEQVWQPDANSPTGKNKVVLNNPAAPPLWARFYEIGTNRPIYSDRDGVPRSELSQISYERRNGYAWLVDSPAELLERDYPAWKEKLAK